MTPEQSAQAVAEGRAEGSSPETVDEEGPVQAELLIEDVSIDGMCGVY